MSSEMTLDAAQLIRYALDPKLLTDRSEEYRLLTQRYRMEVPFQDVVEAVARGLGLEVVDVSEWGLVLGARPGSPFMYSMSDWRKRSAASYEARILHGLAVVAIAACYYPDARALESEHHRPLSVGDVETFLRNACGELRRRSGDEPPADNQPEYEQAWRIVDRQKSVAGSEQTWAERALQPVIRRCFELLADRGLVRKMKGEERWQPLNRFRSMLGGIAAHYAYTELAAIRAEQEPTDV
jgi:hypothetical protein